jgi:hypothetical protein
MSPNREYRTCIEHLGEYEMDRHRTDIDANSKSFYVTLHIDNRG